MNKKIELDLCRKFVENMKQNNKPQALSNLNTIIESKIAKRIQEKKEAILASKKF